jgi:hypothetical protein
MGSDHVCLLGKTGSDRRTVKVTRLTQLRHSLIRVPPSILRPENSQGPEVLQRLVVIFFEADPD